jgi:hypothetical protein
MGGFNMGLGRRSLVSRESLPVGILVFGLIGTSGVLVLLKGVINFLRTDTDFWKELDGRLVVCAAVGAALAGTLCWQTMLRHEPSPRSGAGYGLMTGLAAHPLCWFLYFSTHLIWGDSFHFKTPKEWLFLLTVGVLLASVSSLGMVGWLSGPVGALLGYLTFRIRRPVPDTWEPG